MSVHCCPKGCSGPLRAETDFCPLAGKINATFLVCDRCGWFTRIGDLMPDTTEDQHFQPGAVWVAKRAGSRAANRIVQSIGRIPRYGMQGSDQGVQYLVRGSIAWCTHEAWKRWVIKQSAEFSHISSEYVKCKPPS